MDRTEMPQRVAGAGADPDVEGSDNSPKAEIEPEAWRDLTEFRDRFSDVAVSGIWGEPEEDPEGFWIVRDIEKVRPSAVPIDQAPTFDMTVLDPDGTVTGELRLTIEEIEHVRAADPSDE